MLKHLPLHVTTKVFFSIVTLERKQSYVKEEPGNTGTFLNVASEMHLAKHDCEAKLEINP